MVRSLQQQPPQPSQDELVKGGPEATPPKPGHLHDVVAVRKEMQDRLARIMMQARAA